MKTLKDLRVVKAAEVNPDEGVVDVKTKKNVAKTASAKAEIVGTNESMRELTRTINRLNKPEDEIYQTQAKKKTLAKSFRQILSNLVMRKNAVKEDTKKPYVPTVDYVNNPKMKYTPPSVLRRLAAIKKRQAKEATVKEEVLSSLDEARIRIIKARIRGGKLQRRKKVSNVKGYTIRGGKLTRMSSKEKLHRKRGARIGKVKRRAKLARALVKRKRSLRKRSALGL